MNKGLKVTLIVLGVLVGGFLILGVVAPKEYKVERTATIKADAAMVFDQIRTIKNIDSWSPWSEYDPNMKVKYSGTDGEVGSYSEWEGNDDVGQGRQELVSISPNKVETKVNFIKPWEAEINAYFQIENGNGETKITWGTTGTTPFPWNALGVFMSMDDMMGKDFERGLEKLKKKVETAPVAAAVKYEIAESDAPAQTFIIKKKELTFDQIPAFFMENLPKIFEGVEKKKLQMTGNPSGLFFSWDDKAMKTNMAAGIPVAGDEKTKIDGFETFVVPAGKTLTIDYYGAYEKTMGAHLAMDDYMKEKGLTQNGPVIEEYITDPGVEKDTTKWLTKIYYKVK